MQLDKKNKWIIGSNLNFYDGFTDSELDVLCNVKDFMNFPILFWPTELYSFGKCYRDWLGFPKGLPIPFYGDHGVDLSGILHNHEKNNKSRIHLTWSKSKFKNIDNFQHKKLFYITNPWVLYRRKRQIELKKNRKGTVVFFAHSNVGIELESSNFDLYFKDLDNLDKSFSPLIICLHMHDINKGLHKKIRKYGYPIITVGNSFNSCFVDRFYDIISNFKQATSNKIGSQLFYCTEMGLPYFLYGEPPILMNNTDNNIPLGKVNSYTQNHFLLTEKITKLYSNYYPYITTEQQNLTQEILGLDSTIRRSTIQKYFIIELFRLFPFYFFLQIKKTYVYIYKQILSIL
jgi:hypothetical protein